MILQMDHYSTDIMLEVNRKFCSGQTHTMSKWHAVAHKCQRCSGLSLMVTVYLQDNSAVIMVYPLVAAHGYWDKI